MLNEHVTYAVTPPALRVFEMEDDMSVVFKSTKFELFVVGDVISWHCCLPTCFFYLHTGVLSKLFHII